MRTKRKGYIPSDYSYICANHFVKDKDYKQGKFRKRLLKGAIPSVFVWSRPNKERRTLISRSLEGSSTDSASESGEALASERQESFNYLDQETQTAYSHFGVCYLACHPNQSLLHFYSGFKDRETFDAVLKVI